MMSRKRTAHKTTTTAIITIIIIIIITGGTDLHCILCIFSYVCVHVIELICMQSSIFRIKVSGADIIIVWPLAWKWQSVKFSSILWPDNEMILRVFIICSVVNVYHIFL